MIICPICQTTLNKHAKQWSCSNGHSFDQAKEGYTNLLVVQHKHSKNPGDSKAMMQARRRFLSQGHYGFLSQAINEQVAACDPKAVLDIGCGEGYYTQAMQQHIGESAQVTGIDISKDAVRMAAKRCKQSQFFVASNHRLPICDAGIDIVVRVFAPSEDQELLRVTKQDSYLLKVVPGSHHLSILRALLYADVQPHDEEAEEMDGWRVVEQQKLSQTTTLTHEDMSALSLMTPFAWKKNEQLQTYLAQQTAFEMNFEFVLQLYQRG